MESEMEAFQEIASFERELVDPQIRKDAERIAELLSDGFLEFGSSGALIREHDVLDAAQKPGTTTH